MLTTRNGLLTFRHELARLTVEDAVPLARRVDLHRAALAELEARPAEGTTIWRDSRTTPKPRATPLPCSGTVHAPPSRRPHSARTGRPQVSTGGRCATRTGSPSRDAPRFSEAYSGECYLTDEPDEVITALRSTAEAYRALGDRLKEGATLGRLADHPVVPRARGAEGTTGRGRLRDAARDGWGPNYRARLRLRSDGLSSTRMNADLDSAESWSSKATSVAEKVGDADAIEWTRGGRELLEIMSGSSAAIASYRRRADWARSHGDVRKLVDILDALVLSLIPCHGYTLSREHIEEGVTLSRACGHELSHVYLLSHQARLELDQGQWEDAAEFAEFVLGKRLVSTFPRTLALVSLALVRARRGDPDVWTLLDEARDLADPTGEVPRIAPVAAARGEAAMAVGSKR